VTKPYTVERLKDLRREIAEIIARNQVYGQSSTHIDDQMHEARRERLKEIRDELALLRVSLPRADKKSACRSCLVLPKFTCRVHTANSVLALNRVGSS
jgi:RNase P subunit RPR2